MLFWKYREANDDSPEITQQKKWSFPLRISSVNVTKYAVSSRSGHIYWENP